MSRIKKLFEALPLLHRRLLLPFAGIFLLALFWPSQAVHVTRDTPLPGQLTLHQRYPLPLPLPSNSPQSETVEPEWQTLYVAAGDSLAKLFQRAGFSAQELHQLMQNAEIEQEMTALMPGDSLKLARDAAGRLAQLIYPISATETLHIQRQGNQFVAEKQVKQVDTRLNFASADIYSSFWNAGVDAGLTPNLIMELANIFGWDIDFALDIRKGDQFSILYEEQYLDGEYLRDGQIVAAEFINHGEVFRAIRYADGNYYAPDGHAMRKAFLRAPVNFKYISSNFNPRRLHPVTGKVRPHRGIDYVARRGTPIMASGDGKVIKSAYNRLNGNYVFIQHGARYVTKYLHLNKRKVKKGQRVKQGQIIGTMGATGRVTGTHLHYEFLVNGVHRNPRTVSLPESKPIAKKARRKFLDHAAKAQQKLEARQRVMLAMHHE